MRPVFEGHPHGVFIRISSASQPQKLVSTMQETQQNQQLTSAEDRADEMRMKNGPASSAHPQPSKRLRMLSGSGLPMTEMLCEQVLKSLCC